ncbi:major facilitator superfamily MFS-1 [Cristinia sonorae]|uniref:Major facilitator superfamily MFS-1 n=1 Tax=Cristinia sonorae TaxID=1940300 RepID=A0A8K0UTK1_9AGAR|nr:major facilitator superfamily MFS-1 [Cristinia sonorae]
MSGTTSPAGGPALSKRTFGPQAPLTNEDEQAQDETQSSRRPSGRVSFSAIPRRASFFNRWRRGVEQDDVTPQSPKPDKPPIPSALQPAAEVYATPLPTLSMVVLSITMLGEFLSANVSAPFLLFMVEGFHQFRDEADVGYWTGLLVSTFFLTQFLTSLLWATVAAKHGSRTVLFVALLGSSVTCCLFGTSTTIQEAMAIRLMQGVFAGAIGVARGSVTGITDQSNEGRAYAILGFCWGFGGVSGAIVGGTFENPARKWPAVFAKIPIFVNYPYLLPCAVAASFTFTGSMLSLFLGPNCGPREGAIRLPVEKPDDEEQVGDSRPTTPIPEETEERGLVKKVSKKLSGYFARRVHDAHAESPTTPPVQLTSTAPGKNRTFSRTSRITGSAYGYTGAYRNRLASNVTLGTRRGSLAGTSMRRRRESNVDGAPSSVATGSDLNFAQRLLMANENAVTNIADLWVAAAMNVDNEDPFESESDVGGDEAVVEEDELDEADIFGQTPVPSSHVNRFLRHASTSAHTSPGKSPLRSNLLGSRRASGSQRRPSGAGGHLLSPHAHDEEALHSPRRLSMNTAPIFSHVGVRTPPAVLEAQQLLQLSEDPGVGPSELAPISESRPLSQEAPSITTENEPSLWSQLPVLVIVQYGLLALHSTTHDQVFYLYLVSKYPSGGLNLNAGHFSQLIALMCLAQIAYQFYFYPNIGPPRGRFSHLAMFRIGSLLYIPAYLSVILYRVFASASDDGNIVVMGALAVSTAIRYAGITFSYTAISVLLNYMSPPHIVGYANGIAQSIVSLARFFGPIIGGLLWSVSVQDNPAGYPIGFLVCSGVCALAVATSFMIR